MKITYSDPVLIFTAYNPNLQIYFPVLKPLNLKVSYHPSQNYNNGNVDHFIEYYEGKKYWITLGLHEYLPSNLKNYWPSWLNIAVGYDEDYSLVKIFNPKKDNLWSQVLDILDLVHFPAPAIRFEPSAIYYGLYF